MTGTDSKMRGHLRKRGTSATAAKCDVSELVAESSNPSSPQRLRSHRLHEVRLRRVLDYITENLGQEITIAQLASVSCLSPSHFVSVFSRAVGVAPYHYVSLQRLENAKMMLADGKRSLSDIAFSCQFSSQSSFHRAFLRAIGVTPGEYRRARVEERYLALRPDWVKAQQVHRHPCASRRDYRAPLSVRASLAIEDGRPEEALQNLPQHATTVPYCANCGALGAPSVVEASPAILSWRCRPDGEMETHSRGWIAYFGLDLRASLKGWANLIHHDDSSAHFERWRKALATGESYVSEARYRCADGEWRPILVRANPHRDERGQIVKWNGVNTPLSDTVDDVLAQLVPVDDGLGVRR
jgi:AraC-like DNA-binding protein